MLRVQVAKMTEKDWDAWKNHDTYEMRSIYRFEAEKEQIELKPWSNKRLSDENQILVRGIFVGTIPNTWTVYLRLGDHQPIVNVMTNEGIHFQFIPSLKDEKE